MSGHPERTPLLPPSLALNTSENSYGGFGAAGFPGEVPDTPGFVQASAFRSEAFPAPMFHLPSMTHQESMGVTADPMNRVAPITPEDLEDRSDEAPEQTKQAVRKPDFSAALMLPHAQFSLPKTVHALPPTEKNLSRRPFSDDDRPGPAATYSDRSISKAPARGVKFVKGAGGSSNSDRNISKLAKGSGGAGGLRWSTSTASQANVDTASAADEEEAEGTALAAPSAASGGFSIRMLVSKKGMEEYISPVQTHPLLPDACLWLKSASSVKDLPNVMRDLKFLQTRPSDAKSSNSDYLVMKFQEPTEVYLLVHSLAKPPKWLTDDFTQLEHTTVDVNWHLGTVGNISSYIGLTYQRAKSSNLQVWKMKKSHLPAGDVIILGGLNHRDKMVPVFNYVVCWKVVMDLSMTPNKQQSRHYKSKELLNEALEDAVVRQDVVKAAALLKSGADVNMTLSASAFKGCLLTKVPAVTLNMQMLVTLVEHGAELDWHALTYVLTYSHNLPVAHAPIADFLTRYVRSRRNPANTCYAIALCLSTVSKQHTSKNAEYVVLSEKFRMTTINLIEDLNKLSYIGGKERWMLRPDEVLEPTKHYSEHFPINLASCSSTALKMHDTDYSSTSTVQNFMKRAWVGVHFIQVAHSQSQGLEDYSTGTTGINSNMYLLSLLSQYGFAGPIGRKIMTPPSQLANLATVCARPFFDSPRGRWYFKCLCHAMFMVCFHIALFEPKAWEHDSRRPAEILQSGGLSAWVPEAGMANPSPDVFLYSLLGVMCWWIVAMAVDIFHVAYHQFAGSVSRFLAVESFSNQLDLVQFFTLFISVLLWVLAELASNGVIYMAEVPTLRALKILFSISAIVVWVQTMFILRPLNKGLAPLLYVIGQMMAEVLVFLIPLMALLVGFATAIFSLFWGDVHLYLGWNSIWDVLLMLFRFFVSDFQMSFDMFKTDRYDAPFEIDPVLRLYAIFILILYVVFASILMANLLIAVLTYKYDPEKIDAESNFQSVMTLEDYQVQVDKRLLPAPFSPITAAARILHLPRGMRPKLKRSFFAMLLLPPLDDECDVASRPTGARELPYFVYLLFMGLVINVLFLVLMVLVSPYCILQFSVAVSHTMSTNAVKSIVRVQQFRAAGTNSSRRASRSFLSRSSFFTRTSQSSRSARKLFQLVVYLSVVMFTFPLMLPLAAVMYALLAVFLAFYVGVWTWTASLLYSVFWIVVGTFGPLVHAVLPLLARAWRVAPEDVEGAHTSEDGPTPTGMSATAGSQGAKAGSESVAAGATVKNKRWGKLLAKQRKEEFKKIAFRPEEVDTALLCAGISIPAEPGSQQAAGEAAANKSLLRSGGGGGGGNVSLGGRSNASSSKPGFKNQSSLKGDKARFNASVAEGKAKMNASLALNASLGATGGSRPQPRGLAGGIARFDSRYPDRAGRAKAGALPSALMKHKSMAPGAAAMQGGAAGPLMEAGGLINEMGGVRDDLADIQMAIQDLTLEVVRLKRMLQVPTEGSHRSLAGSDWDNEQDYEDEDQSEAEDEEEEERSDNGEDFQEPMGNGFAYGDGSDSDSSDGRGAGLLDVLDAELHAPKPPPSQNNSYIGTTDVQASSGSFEAVGRQ